MDNFKLHKRSDLDKYEMDNRTFDDNKDAWRVSIVDGVTLNVDKVNIPEQKVIEVPVIVKESEIHQINVPVIVKEIEKIEIPVIITEYRTIEIPVIVPEIRIIEIEKPIIVKEIVFKELPTIVKVCMLVQALASVGLLITRFILKG